jgi:hypothetical protein
MEQQASFEARAVLPPRRARRTRLVLLLPAAALALTAWAGLGSPPAQEATNDVDQPAAIAQPSLLGDVPVSSSATPTARPNRPSQVFGLAVRRLDDVRFAGVGRDEIVVLTGWYVPTAITDCPRLPAIYREAALPNLRGDVDTLAFCVRSGFLSVARPDLREFRFDPAGRQAIPATLVIGVIAPLRIETVGTEPTEVVVLGRLVERGAGCRPAGSCGRELLIDHVAWTGGAYEPAPVPSFIGGGGRPDARPAGPSARGSRRPRA